MTVDGKTDAGAAPDPEFGFGTDEIADLRNREII